MKFPIPPDGRVLHGIAGSTGPANVGLVDEYAAVCGPALAPCVEHFFLAFPGDRGIGPTLKSTGKALEKCRASGRGAFLSYTFTGENGPSDVAITNGLHAGELVTLADVLNEYPDVPIMARPGGELNDPAANYTVPSTAHGEMAWLLKQKLNDQISICWGIQHNGTEIEYPPSFGLVDWVGVDFLAKATVTPVVAEALAFAKTHDLPVCVPEASSFVGGFDYAADPIADGDKVWKDWVLPLAQFCASPSVKLLCPIPCWWGEGWPGHADMRIHRNPVTALRWGALLGLRAGGMGFVNQPEWKGMVKP